MTKRWYVVHAYSGFEKKVREEIVAAMREAGYAYAALDLAGFRSGSQNLMLRPKVVAASTAEG